MRTPWPTIIATALYYWFVRSIGPRMMRDRKPYEILPLIRVYNLLMAAWNGFGFMIGCELLNYGRNAFGCVEVDPYQRDELTLTQIYYGWMFYTSRLVEFADTIFFTLRKKESQVTSFHVFHHSSVPTLCWFFLKFVPGGNAAIFPFINTFVHTIMYTYYFLATYPSMRPYLGWKKYLTQIQIVQFLIIIACCLQPLFIPGCKLSRVLTLIMIGLSFVFISLFVDFYLKCYIRGAKKSSPSEVSSSSMPNGKQQVTVSNTLLDTNNNNNANMNSNNKGKLRKQNAEDQSLTKLSSSKRFENVESNNNSYSSNNNNNILKKDTKVE